VRVQIPPRDKSPIFGHEEPYGDLGVHTEQPLAQAAVLQG
jgi:hypothetical protein